MKKPVLRYRTVILSDIHLGTPESKAEQVNFFLKHTRCDKLILNGDIIDGWALQRRNTWQKSHTAVVRRILKLTQKRVIDVIYLRGNHDDFLSSFLPMALDRLQVVEEHVHETPRGNYLVVHGDCFDAVTTYSPWVAKLGDIGYQLLLTLNRYYNKYRALRGKEYYSISKAIKARVKSAVNHIGEFEVHLKDLAQKRNCCGIICGHIHTPEDKDVDGIHYLNSGDWVESMTAIVEDKDGNFEVIGYKEFCQRIEAVRLVEQTPEKRKDDDSDEAPDTAASDSGPEPKARPSEITWHSEEELQS